MFMLQEAVVLAAKELPTTHPIRLGVALNYSVWQGGKKIKKEHEKAEKKRKKIIYTLLF